MARRRVPLPRHPRARPRDRPPDRPQVLRGQPRGRGVVLPRRDPRRPPADLPVCAARLTRSLRRGLLPIANGGTFAFEQDTTGQLAAGQVYLCPDSFLNDFPTEILVVSPFLEAKEGVRRFANSSAYQSDRTNVLIYAPDDCIFFNAIARYKSVCNCIWDKTILREVQPLADPTVTEDIAEVFVGDSFDTFMTQLVKITTGRVPFDHGTNVFDNILSASTNKKSTVAFLPSRVYETFITPFFPKITGRPFKDLLTDTTRRFLFMLDGLAEDRQHFGFTQIPTPWTLQITGYFDDPFIRACSHV